MNSEISNRWNARIGVFAAALAVLDVTGSRAPALAQPAEDHLACYKVKDPAAKRKFSVAVANAAAQVTCTVDAPAKLGCLASSASGIDPAPPGEPVASGVVGHFLCYRMKCPKPFPGDAQLTDELGGRRVVRFRRTTLLCAPASGSPRPVSTTTTLPGQTCHFDDDDRRCEGTCADGGTCSAVVSGGDCECRSTPCGDADAPECEGYCQPDEACVFAVTGCECVAIP